MRKFLLFTFVLVFVFATAAFAGDKITVDPNAGPQIDQAAGTEDIYSADPRLAKKITYSAPHKTVSQIVSDLAEKTGITFKVGYNSQDWQVRDRHMNVFVKDLPLKDLMQSITRVMKFKWSRGGDAPNYSYRLYMDRLTLLNAETASLREEENRRQELAKNRADVLNMFSTIDSMSPGELARLKEADPFSYALMKAGVTKGLGAFFKDVPQAAEALANGLQLTINGSNLSADGRRGLLAATDAGRRLKEMVEGKNGRHSETFTGDLADVTVEVNKGIADRTDQMEASFILGALWIRGDDNDFHEEIPLIKPDSKIANLIGRYILQAQEQGNSLQDLAKVMGEQNLDREFQQAAMEDMKAAPIGEPVIDHSKDATDPDLQKKVKLEYEKSWLEIVEEALSKSSELAVVSDAFERRGANLPLRGREVEVREAVDVTALAFMCNWEKHGRILELRDRDWYRKRLQQIPQAWIDTWVDSLKNTGTIELPELVKIAGLTQEQYTRNLNDEEVIRASDLNVVMFNKELLRAYGSLSDAQRAAVLSPGGLDLSALNEQQWAMFEKLILKHHPNALKQDTPNPTVVFSATRKKVGSFGGSDEKVPGYEFRVVISGNVDTVEWPVPLPRYIPPKKEEPKPAQNKPAAPETNREPK